MDLSAEFYHGISMVADIAGERRSNTNGSGMDLTMVITTLVLGSMHYNSTTIKSDQSKEPGLSYADLL